MRMPMMAYFSAQFHLGRIYIAKYDDFASVHFNQLAHRDLIRKSVIYISPLYKIYSILILRIAFLRQVSKPQCEYYMLIIVMA